MGQSKPEGLSGRLLKAREQEQNRIARELHDDVGQQLAFICGGA
jgi:signal transduction histidine kinase